MRFSSALAQVLACGAVVFVSACSAGMPTTPTGSALSSRMRSVFGNAIGPDSTPTPPRRLAVGIFTSVDVLNGSYRTIQTIGPAGLSVDALWYDSKANLYVANQYGPNVNEYNKAGKFLAQYSAGLIYPSDVVVQSGNVYVSDWGNHQASVVVEYPQRSNKPIVSCNTGFANSGVGVDGQGNIFVSAVTPGASSSALLEYKGGLTGCKATMLGVTFSNILGDILIDKHGNLLVCESSVGVDIIPPPYTKVRKTITGAPLALQAALNKEQNLLYIANTDYKAPAVIVDKYPSGKLVTMIPFGGASQIPSAIAAYPH